MAEQHTPDARAIAMEEAAVREHYWIALKRIESVVGNVSLTHDQKVSDIVKIVRTALYDGLRHERP